LSSANHSCGCCDENEAVHSLHSGADLDVQTFKLLTFSKCGIISYHSSRLIVKEQ
jgi:hypothetical protein